MGAVRNSYAECGTYYIYSLVNSDGDVVKVGQTKNPDLRSKQNTQRGYSDCEFNVLKVLSDVTRKDAVACERSFQEKFDLLDGIESKDVRKKLSESIKASWDREKVNGIKRNNIFGNMHNTGLDHPKAKAANIYKYDTDELIAENVSIRQWCRDNGYTQSRLCKTALNQANHHKGIYAVYVNQSEQEN